jgi:glycosyltransferase involved in cell wall biosynthesis
MSESADASQRICIIGKSNGVGLTRDIKLLADCLREGGHEVSVRAIDAAEAKRRRSLVTQAKVRMQLAWLGARPTAGARTDVNVMLEHLWPEFLHHARRNVVVPNPEWFDRNDLRFLDQIDAVWAKTRHSAEIFRGLGSKTHVISFDSEDRHRPEVPRERRFFHLAGKSTMKGTDRLLRAWAERPHWPTLTVMQHSADRQEVRAANIDHRYGYVEEQQLLYEQNACMFHVCTSLTEGWGHYIVEALSVGGLPLTLDAPPMNELVTSERGLLIGHERSGRQRLATTYFFSESGLQSAVERAMALSDTEWSRLSANARRWYESNRSEFRQRVRTALRGSVE